MAKYRQSRINDAVAQELTAILRDVKDPRVSEAMITVTSAEVTADFKYAKIFYSVYGADDDAEAMKDIATGLKSASGFIRRELAHRINLRVTPELTFIADNSMKRGVEIAAIINKFEFSDDGEESNGESEDEQ